MFDWKDDSRKKNNLGLIAQEVEKIVPKLGKKMNHLKCWDKNCSKKKIC